MKRVLSWLAMASLAAACGQSTSPSAGGSSGEIVTVSVSSTTVVANGVNSVTVHVSSSTGSSVTVTTDRGSFAGGAQSAIVAGTGDVVLTTCNTAVDSACAGSAHIRAAGSVTAANAVVTFGSLALCASNCALDAACATRACNLTGGGSGTCSATSPAVCVAPACAPNPPGTTVEGSCSDGIDNDCNGKIDCADGACDGQPCKAGSPTFLCSAGACTDVSSGSAITLTAGRTRLPANGTTTTTLTAKVTKSGVAQTGVNVTFATTLGTLSAPTAITGADGTATVTFTASATSGDATVTASMTALPIVSQSLVLKMPALGQLKGDATFAVMGVSGSGFQEINPITATLVDDQGLAYPEGLDIRFEHHRVGGSRLSTPATADSASCLASDGCVGFLTSTDASGLAGTNLYSGNVAGTLAVVVSATAGGVTRTFTVQNVAVIGARANGANFSIVCNPRNVPAFAESNCSTSLVDAPFTCVAVLKDRFNNLLGTATQVTFWSEAGSVGQVAVTPAYDPNKLPTAQADLGVATQIFNTLGNPLPFMVTDLAPGEPSAGTDACGYGRQPRSGVVTIIAIADGEEAFVDLNGNGVYDGPGSTNLPVAYQASGEPYIDLGEPYVDQNDNGQYDLGEPFLDVNGDGVWNGPNGKWDANTKIWTETVVVYTGGPATDVLAGPLLLGTRWVDNLTPFTDACTPTPPAAPFLVNAAVTGPPALPPTSTGYHVVGSDRNLNLLSTRTSYGIQKAGNITAVYGGQPGYADDYGFTFKLQVCDSTGATCRNSCQATPDKLPCIMKPSVSNFSCGVAQSVTITGGAQSGGDPNTVQWNVSTPYDVYLGSHTILEQLIVDGTNF